MSQAGSFDVSSILKPVQSLTGDIGGVVGPDFLENIDLLGGIGVSTVGNPGANSITFNAPGVDQDNILYVGKHGSDANDGLTINKAFLTFGAAMAAASAGDVLWCFDDGTYTENITGVTLINIHAPNAILTGAHTMANGTRWRFQELKIATATTGITFNSAGGGAGLFVERMTIAGIGVGILNLAGGFFVEVTRATLESGFLLGNTTADQTHITFGEINITGAGTAFGVIAGGELHLSGALVTDNGVGSGTLFSSSGGGTPEIDAIISQVHITELSDITAGSDVRLTVSIIEGTATEGGAGLVSVGGAQRIDNVPIGSVTPSTGVFTNLTATSLGLGVVQSSSGGLLSSANGTDGQLFIAGTGIAPAWASLASTSGTIVITEGANTLDVATSPGMTTDSGFAAWGGAGPYFDDTTLGEFEVSESGYGYINSVRVDWAAPQTETGLTAGNTYYIYIDSTGTIGKTTSLTQTFLQNNIVLFEVLRDSTAGTNNQVTVKENHPYTFQQGVSFWAHETVGVIIENNNNGANITINGTQKIQINGNDELSDHGLYTDISDSAATAVVFNQYFTLVSGKWARYLQSDTFDGAWDNAGTATALSGNKYSVSRLYVSKDNITTVTPTYFSVLGDAEYNNLTAAQTAVANGSIPTVTGELAQLEIAQLGYIIFEESSTSIVDVIIAKETLTNTIILSGTNQAALVLTDTSNFDHILSVADTNVQAALETIDDLILRADGPSDSKANTGVFTIAGGTNVTTTAVGSTITIDLDSPVSATNGGTGIADPTDHSLLVGSGSGAMTELGVATNGQLVIGSTGADPVLATLASADASVTITNGAGTIDLAAAGGGISWNESTGTTQALAEDNGYITNNAAQVVCTLPDTAALGSVIRICGKGDGGWRISQNAGESIIWDESTSTTTGVGGYLASTDDYDTIEILCTVADTTWTVLSIKGNITIV